MAPSFWRRVLPDAWLHPVVSSHVEVTVASGPVVAQVLQDICDRARVQ